MKKLTLISLAFILVISLIGCNKQEDVIGCRSNATVYDYEEFMAIYGQNADASNNTNSLQTVAVSDLIIPKLKTDDFYYTSVLVDENYFQFHYNPVSEDSNINNPNGISINVRREENSFNSMREEEENSDYISHIEFISDRYAYDEPLNMWYVNKNGKCIIIYFPDSIKFTDPERISDYFEFEVLNPSTDNTVTE